MTAHELARKLLAGPDLEVHIACPAGDYWRTTLAPKVTQTEAASVTYSSYHRLYTVYNEERDTDEAPTKMVLLLK